MFFKTSHLLTTYFRRYNFLSLLIKFAEKFGSLSRLAREWPFWWVINVPIVQCGFFNVSEDTILLPRYLLNNRHLVFEGLILGVSSLAKTIKYWQCHSHIVLTMLSLRVCSIQVRSSAGPLSPLLHRDITRIKYSVTVSWWSSGTTLACNASGLGLDSPLRH